MFVAVTRLLVKKHGKGLRIPNERMETLRRAAAVIECIGEECAANKTS